MYTVAGSLPMASAVILLPFYMQYLPSEIFGALALYLAFSILVQIIVSYSFDSSTYIHYHEYKNDRKKLSEFISSAFVFVLLISAGVGLVLVVLGDLLFDRVYDNPEMSFYPYGLMAVAIGIFQAVFKVYSNILQSSEKPILFFRSNLLQFVLIVALTVGGLYFFPGTLVGPVGGRMLAGLGVAGWSLYRVFSEYGFHFNFQLLKSTFGFNNYTFIHQVQQWVINYIDRFVILFFLPLSTVGFYDFALKCLIVIEFILNGLHNSFYPKVVSTITAQTVKGSTTELNRYYHGMISVIMIIVCLSIFVLPFLFDIFQVKRGYEEAVNYFPYIGVIYILRAIRYYFAIPYGAIKYTKPLPVISFFVAVLKITLLVLLIREYEVYGVIVATILTTIVEIMIMRYVLASRYQFKFNIMKLIIVPCGLLLMVLVLEPLLAHHYGWQVHLLYVVVTAMVLLWIYRNELRLLVGKRIV